jgi:hypothetical protein
MTANAGSEQRDLQGQGKSGTDLVNISSWNILKLAGLFTRFVHRQRAVRFRPELAILFLLAVPALSNAMELKPETVQAWDAYVLAAKTRIEKRVSGQAPFLWVDERPERAQRVRAGEIVVEPAEGESPHTVPRGLIHDWIGAVFIPKARLDEALGVLNDYGRYKDFYRPMVAKSRLLTQTPGHEKVSLLMVQKAYAVTAAVQTDNEVDIARLDANRAYSLSNSIRVQEIANYGQPSERVLPEDQGPGYVWRTLTVTRVEQRDGGVYVEIELVGLTRSIPWAFRWLIQPLAERLAPNILRATLNETRDAVSKTSNVATSSNPAVSR